MSMSSWHAAQETGFFGYPDDAPEPCGAEPPTGMAHNTPCELDAGHMGDHQNIARNWPNTDDGDGPDLYCSRCDAECGGHY